MSSRSSGWCWVCARRRDWPCRPCSRFPAALPDPSPRNRAWNRRSSPSAFHSPLIEQRPGNARLWPRFRMLMEVRERLFARFRSVTLGDFPPFRLTHAKQARAASFAPAAPDAIDVSRARRRAAVSENAAQNQREYRPVFLCQWPSEEQSCGNSERPQWPIRIILAWVQSSWLVAP